MSKKGFIRGSFIGAAVGVITGLLFAPKSGKETREDIKEAANKAAKQMESKLKNLHDEVLERKGEADKFAAELKGKAKVEMEDLSTRAEIARKKLGELLSAVRDGGADDTLVQKTIKEAEQISSKIKTKLK